MKNKTYQMPRTGQSRAVVAFFCLSIIAVTVGVVGCNSEIDPMLKTLDANVLSAKTNDISRTMDFIFDDRQFEQKEFEEKVSIGLNRWANYSSQEVTQADVDSSDVVKQLIEKFQDVEVVEQNDQASFINTDPYFLQEAYWVSAIAKRVTAGQFLNLVEFYRLAADNFRPEDDDKTPIDSLIAKLHPTLDQDGAQSLSKALLLFDWTVRNIYLLPELNPSEDEIQQQRLSDDANPVSAGIRFTGTQRHPWQTLVLSRGDYVDRAKVFLMLARESGLTAAMLTTGAEETPWAVGVVIDDQYYLFDTKLGLPIANNTLGQIATLQQIQDNPKLLSALDLTLKESLAENTKYWVGGDDLSSLTAKVYVVPESLSRRINGLEESLVGEYRLALGSFPSKQLQHLPEADGVEKKLWDVAFETHRFRDAVRKALPKAVSDDQLNDRLRWYFAEEAYIDNFHPYRTCRVRFFKGDFETLEEDLSRNAVESFQFLTYSDEQIDNLGTDNVMMSIAGLADIKDAAEFDARLRSTQRQMRLVRRDVGLFLSQCLFDNGSPGTSANWLETIVNKDDVQRWKSGVMYLLGRSYESRKEYDRAMEQYQFEDSQQVHGNLIRVRLMRSAIKKAYPGADVTDALPTSESANTDSNVDSSPSSQSETIPNAAEDDDGAETGQTSAEAEEIAETNRRLKTESSEAESSEAVSDEAKIDDERTDDKEQPDTESSSTDDSE